VQIKKAGFLTKIVVLTLLVASAVSLLRLQGQISEAREEQAEMERKVAQQSQVNADLRDAIDHSSDPDRQEAIARSELNLAAPGEKVIIFTD
jgi:cell division protein FtsL